MGRARSTSLCRGSHGANNNPGAYYASAAATGLFARTGTRHCPYRSRSVPKCRHKVFFARAGTRHCPYRLPSATSCYISKAKTFKPGID